LQATPQAEALSRPGKQTWQANLASKPGKQTRQANSASHPASQPGKLFQQANPASQLNRADKFPAALFRAGVLGNWPKGLSRQCFTSVVRTFPSLESICDDYIRARALAHFHLTG
jgi:hypothetical protein